MEKVSLKEARARLSELVTRASRGQVIAITRRGKAVARLVVHKRPAGRLPSMAGFRAMLIARGVKVTQSTVEKMRREERY